MTYNAIVAYVIKIVLRFFVIFWFFGGLGYNEITLIKLIIMKKFLIFIFIIAVVVLGARFLIGGDEDAWLCENGMWVEHGHPDSEAPSEPCPADAEIDTEAETAKSNIGGGLLGALNKAKELNADSYTWDLSGQGLTSLPTELFTDRDNVKIFAVSGNKLTGALPAEIRLLTSLEKLDASNNNLTGIPAEIGQLDKIREIDFSNNDIDTFPNEIINLADTLVTLNLRGNKFSPEQLEALQVMLPGTDIIAH